VERGSGVDKEAAARPCTRGWLRLGIGFYRVRALFWVWSGAGCWNPLRERFGEDLVSVVVYGSFARGEAREGSDLDVLVVVGRQSGTG